MDLDDVDKDKWLEIGQCPAVQLSFQLHQVVLYGGGCTCYMNLSSPFNHRGGGGGEGVKGMGGLEGVVTRRWEGFYIEEERVGAV